MERKRGIATAIRTVGRALDSTDVNQVAELRSVLATMATYAQRRELMLDRERRRGGTDIDLRAESEHWLGRIPIPLRWRAITCSSRRPRSFRS